MPRSWRRHHATLVAVAVLGWTFALATTTTATTTTDTLSTTNTTTSTLYATATAASMPTGGCVSANLTLAAGEGGVVSSQGGGSLYAADARCTWRLQAPSGWLVRAALEPFSTECGYDTLSLYDGAALNTTLLLGTWSGPRTLAHGYTRADNTLLSTTNALTLDFQADGTVEAGGFTLRYQVVNASGICADPDWPCQNGGTCAGGACTCTPAFRGPFCQYGRGGGSGVLVVPRASPCHMAFSLIPPPASAGTAGYPDYVPRAFHAAAYDPLLDVVYISGGQASNQSALADLLAYSFGRWCNYRPSARGTGTWRCTQLTRPWSTQHPKPGAHWSARSGPCWRGGTITAGC